MSNNNDSFFRNSVLPAAAGAAAATIYKRKFANTKVNNFIPVMDPRNNLLNTVQDLKLESLETSAFKKFEVDYSISRLDALKEQGEAAAKYQRLQEYTDFTSGKSNIFKMNRFSPEGMKSLSESVVRREWEAAVQATFPNPTAAKTIYSGGNIFESIKSTLRSNQSVMAQRAWNVFEKNIGTLQGFSVSKDLNLMNVSSMFPTGFRGLETKKISIQNIGSAHLRETIESIESSLGTTLTASFRGTPGQGEYLFSLPGQNEPLFNIPQSFGAPGSNRQGLIRTGAGLQNIYSPGEFGIVNEAGEMTETLTYSEFKAKRIYDTILEKRLSPDSPGLRNIFKEVAKDLSTIEDYREANLPGMQLFPETVFRNEQLRLISSSGETIDDQRRVKLAKELYEKGFTPAGAQSRFVSLSPEHLYGEFGKQSDYARKPWQLIKQYLPTAEAQEAMKNAPLRGDPSLSFMDSPMMSRSAKGTAGARLKTLYLGEQELKDLSSKFKMNIEDGELLINQMTKNQFEVQRTKRINVFELDTTIAQKMTKEGGIRLENITESKMFSTPVKVSGILGRSAEGKLVESGAFEVMGISPSVIQSPSGKETIRSLDLILRENIQMSDAEKVFGSIKGMARFINPNENFLESISQVTGRSLAELKDIDVFARADDIKDTARQMNAVASSMIIAAKEQGKSLNSFSLLDELQGIASKGGDVKSNLMSFQAQKMASLGLTGGIDLDKGGIAASQLYFGGGKDLTGAGNIAKMDPRLFNLLKGSNPGGMAQEITEDMIVRINRWNPSKVSMHGELLKTVKSLAGSYTPQDWETVVAAKDLENPTVVENLKRKGGFVETGLPAAPRMYIPGYENVPELSPRLVATGSLVDTSESSKIFGSMIRDIRSYNTGTGSFSEKEMMDKMQGSGGYLARLTQEVALEGKGSGSIARGEIAGSRAFTLLSEINPQDQGSFRKTIESMPNMNDWQKSRIVGINWNKAQEMFSEMEKLYGVNQVKGMRTRFQEGGLIAGMAMRHPTIGPYSAQPVLFKSVNTQDDVMLSAGNRKTFDFIGAQGEVISKELEIGPLTGWAADKDADTIAGIMMEPQQESKMRSMLMDQNSSIYQQQQKEYMDHSIRMQLLKPKASKSADFTATMGEKAAASSIRLGATKEEVGRISVALTKARTAVMSSNLDQASKLKNLSMLEWLEQIPISAKHVSVENVLSGLFQRTLQETKLGVAGDAALLEGSIASMSEGVPSELKGLFQEGVTLASGEKIAGFDVPQRAKDITNSVMEFSSLPRDSQLAAHARYGAPSQGLKVSFQDLPNVVSANRLASPSSAARMSRGAMAELNSQLSSIVQKSKGIAKPLGVGLAVAAGASLLLGSSPGTLNTTATMQPMNRIPAAAATPDMPNSSRDEISMPSQGLGSPTVAPQMQPKAVMIDEGTASRKSMHVRINANNVRPSQREEFVNRANGRFPGSQINVNVRDDRKRMNAHSISDIIDS